MDKFAINKYKFDFQRESLVTSKISLDKVFEVEHSTFIEAQHILFPGLRHPVLSCNFLKKQFLPKNYDRYFNPQKRIYITRKNATYRRILNEENLISFLENFGFESVQLEGMTISDQALLFAQSEVVIAPHGAGLANLVFCQPGTQVMELQFPNFITDVYYNISNSCNLKYYYLIGENDESEIGSQRNIKKADMYMQLDSVLELLYIAGIS